VPSLFGGNVDRGHTAERTLSKEIGEESQQRYALTGRPEHRGTVPEAKYTQQLYTSVVQPVQPPQQASTSHSSAEHRETSGFFMPSLAQLNAPGPLTQQNVKQVVSDLFLQQAQREGLNTQPQELAERMGWHTLQFAQQQLVSDSHLYRSAQTHFQQARDGLMPPPVLRPRASAYEHSVVNEAFNAMPPIQRAPAPSQLGPAAGRSVQDMEIESEADFNAQRRKAGNHGFNGI
jgi:hypothetical protein